ncbi:hypothetical protein E3P92_02626 [Wallemia ichthyophaga]|nr:hypothetical protein E3P92_02626 [Wallemia ichthyophaga]TIB32823.1 hypothetical protein E3P84_02412 [Wallemia ichthyophaga]TIB41035.1 hypothetical protein E3P83_02365 [Wallemia ichthyophaga]
MNKILLLSAALAGAVVNAAVFPQEATTESQISSTHDRRDYGPPGVGYYRFCKDKYCTLDCSINFRTTDTGCINGGDFQSMQVHGGLDPLTHLTLVTTPHDSCSCQDACWHATGPECIELPDDIKNKGSYRMIYSQSACFGMKHV